MPDSPVGPFPEGAEDPKLGELKPNGGASQKPKDLRKRLAWTSLSNVGRYFLTLAVAFMLTPFVVRTLGDSGYGTWVVLLSVIGYVSILEMGVQPAVVKLVGQYKAIDASDKLSELITTAGLFFLVVGIASALGLCLVGPTVVGHFVEGSLDENDLRALFFVLALDIIVMFLNCLFTGVLYGLHRYHLRNVIDICGLVINAVLVVTTLERGGLLALAFARLATSTLILAVSVISCFKVFPQLRLAPGSVGRRSFQELLSFGGRVFVSATTTRAAAYAQPLIIGSALSSAAIAFYSIPTRLVSYSRQISGSITTGFMPMFSDLHSRRLLDEVRQIYLSSSRYVCLSSAPVLALLLVYGPAFIGLWIGPEYEERGKVVLHLLTAAAIVDSFQPLIWRLFIGVGRLNAVVAISAVTSGLVVLASIVLVNPLGLEGVAASVLMGSVLSQMLYTVYVCRHFQLPIGSLLRQVHLRPIIVGVATWSTARLMEHLLGSDSYWVIVQGGIVAGLVFMVLVVFVGVSSHERRVALEYLNRFLPGSVSLIRGGR